MAENSLELNVSRLTSRSGRFASRLFDRLPELETDARMTPASEGEFDLLVEVPSPSGDPIRTIVAWMDEGVEPSVGFGEWHTHGGVESDSDDIAEQSDGVIDLIQAILADRFVLTNDVGGPYDGAWGVVDLRAQDALIEALTSEYSPGRAKIRTWSGRGDREIGLEDLTLD